MIGKMTKEEKFYDVLQNIFVGAKVDGQGGFINLMKMKGAYYQKIEILLKEDIGKALKEYPSFKEELFDKIYSFFNRYFTQNGSICFDDTAFHNNVYEKVYTNEKDVVLFWKTKMLYYVKTDNLYQSLLVEFDKLKFYFDASNLENKKTNGKKEVLFFLDEVRKDSTIAINISYKTGNNTTKDEGILASIKKKGVSVSEEQLEKAFKIFKRQSEVDYFINKNAKNFLQEQFKIWSYQYFWEGASEWSADRVNHLQILKNIAFKIIDFVAQFEDELVEIWNKPKFVKNSNYVISIDKLDKKLVERIKEGKGYQEQLEEWKALGIDKNASKAPVDTKYFKDLEIDILAQFDNLDEALDGWLIKSENYQALNTILPKFKEKMQCIYIDPPFNTGGDFSYVDKFQDSTWMSLMQDRVKKGRDFLKKEGNFFYHIDRHAYYYSRILFNDIFGGKNFKAEISWDTAGITGFKPGKNNWVQNSNYLIHFSKDTEYNIFNRMFVVIDKEEQKKLGIGWLDLMFEKNKNKYYVEKWIEGKLVNKYVETDKKKHPVGMIWYDIYSFLFSQVGNNESFFFTTQKPENLLRRIIQSSANQRDFVMDYFVGLGTSISVAHKLNRRWIGIDMGEHFSTFYNENEEKKIGTLGRMKIVLSGDQEFEVFNHPRRPQLSRNIGWQGGGFFKYYELEHYEETLANCKYTNGDLFQVPDRSPYQEYIFMGDEKMLKSLEIDYQEDKVTVDLTKLYDNIDIAETLSNLTGKWIKAVKKDKVIFVDGTEINTKHLDHKQIKPLIWWSAK